jgi:hypothetical protein
MLSFVDTTHYRIVFDCLEAEYNAHVNAFGSANASLSEDDFNDLADQLGFVDEQPLIDFEQQLGFPSYRRWYENELEQWFDNGGDPESFPILHIALVQDRSCMSCLL